jgi:hypothetical protein
MDGAQERSSLAALLQPRRMLPVHYDDYTVMTSPLGDFLRADQECGLSERIVECRRGQRAMVTPGGRTVVDRPPGRPDQTPKRHRPQGPVDVPRGCGAPLDAELIQWVPTSALLQEPGP